MKTIRIWYDGLDGAFNIHSNFLSSVLEERYYVVLDEKIQNTCFIHFNQETI